MSFADRVNQFNAELVYKGKKLPKGIRIMNPFRETPAALDMSNSFYKKYYEDDRPRNLILGINPGRFGAGLTGIPFTDPKRLVSVCAIPYDGKLAHEPSSVFVYDVIRAFGGPDAFYRDFYINSICPLGFTKTGEKGREKNYNYYDSKELSDAVQPFIIDNIQKQIALGVRTGICICFGTGKNEAFLRKVNDEYGFFHHILALEHPRFIMQYKSASKQFYIDKYVNTFHQLVNYSSTDL